MAKRKNVSDQDTEDWIVDAHNSIKELIGNTKAYRNDLVNANDPVTDEEEFCDAQSSIEELGGNTNDPVTDE